MATDMIQDSTQPTWMKTITCVSSLVFVIIGVCIFKNIGSIHCCGREGVVWYIWLWSKREWLCVQTFETDHSVLWSCAVGSHIERSQYKCDVNKHKVSHCYQQKLRKTTAQLMVKNSLSWVVRSIKSIYSRLWPKCQPTLEENVYLETQLTAWSTVWLKINAIEYFESTITQQIFTLGKRWKS